MNRAVFLDRDGTIVHGDGDLRDPSQVQLIRGAASAIAALRTLGYRIVVVSNQGGVARGNLTEAEVDAVNQRIAQLVRREAGVEIDRFYYCPFSPSGTVEAYRRDHPWRKPRPGMLLAAAKDMEIELESSWMVGDAMRDVEAGAGARVRTVLLAGSDAGHFKEASGGAKPDFVVATLTEAVRLIAQQRRPGRLEPVAEEAAGVEPARVESAPAGPSAAASRGDLPADGDPEMELMRLAGELGVGEVEVGGESRDEVESPGSIAPLSKTVTITPVALDRGRAGREAAVSDAEALRQLACELRSRQDRENGWYFTMGAGAMQAVAIGCGVMALWHWGQSTTFLQWIAATIAAQLAAVTLLLMRGQR